MKRDEILANGYLIRTGIKGCDFIVLNPLMFPFPDEELKTLDQIILPDSQFWNEIKSAAWSASCHYFFVVNEESIIIGGPHTDNAIICNRTDKIFKLYTDIIYKRA